MIEKIKNELVLNKFVKNFIKIFCGQNLGSIFQIICMWIIIHVIGNDNNGILIMAQTYSYLVSDIMNMQTFNAVIKFLTESIQKRDNNKAKIYIKTGFILDFSMGFASLIMGFLFFNIIAKWMNWNSNFYVIAMIYLPTVLVRNALTGTATGILRYYEKYGIIIKINVYISAIRLIGYMMLWFFNVGLLFFVIVEVLLEFGLGITLIVLSIKELIKMGLGDFYKSKLSTFTNASFLRFNIYNSITLTMDLLLGNISNMFLSRMLGFSSVSVYRVLERIGSIAQRFTTPIMQLFYPEMCSLVSKGSQKKAIKLVNKYIFVSMPLCLILFCFVIGFYNQWMKLFFNNYNEYFIITAVYMAFALFTTITAPIHSLMFALEYVRQNAISATIINIIYIIALKSAVLKFGLLGFIILKLIQAVLMIVVKYIYIIKNIESI